MVRVAMYRLRSFLLSVCLALASGVALADAQYLHWMVDLDSEQSDLAFDFATIRQDGESEYLTWTDPSTQASYTEVPGVDIATGLSTATADVYTNLGSMNDGSLVIELWQAETGESGSNLGTLLASKTVTYQQLQSGGYIYENMSLSGDTFAAADFTPAPEPSSSLLAILGMAVLALRRRRSSEVCHA